MKTILKIFLQGLLVFVPIVGTVALVSWVLLTIDQLIPVDIPFAGLGIVIGTVFVLGLFTSNVVGRKLLEWLEAALRRVPLVNIVYRSLKDLLGAFVGDERSFDEPVMLEVADGVRVFGFVTCRRFDDARLQGQVAVYLPQAYNFAGNLLIVPRERVQPVDADSAQFMAFVVSGGVATMSAARTAMDSSLDLVR